MLDYLSANWIELFGFITGFIYVILEIRQNPLLWPMGIIVSATFGIIFFKSKFYADMGLQAYYILISAYGWYWWLKGTKANGKTLPVSHINPKQIIPLVTATAFIFICISYVLKTFTDSPLPFWDSFTTSLSITATWMLARKIIEQWHIWMLVNLISAGLYIYKEIYYTAAITFVYFIFSIIGFYEWKKSMVKPLLKP